MDNPERNAMRDLELGIWAKEAVCCPVCKVAWTVESIEKRDPQVANVEPRILVCPGCWERWLRICDSTFYHATRAGGRTLNHR